MANKFKNNHRKRNSGAIIPMVLLVTLILLILSFSLSNTALQHAYIVNHETWDKQAFSQAYSGLFNADYYLSTLNDWSSSTLLNNSTLNLYKNGTGTENNPKAGTDPNYFYRVSVNPVSPPNFEPFTASITSTGTVVRDGDQSKILLTKTIHANVHQEGPKSLTSSVFAEGCITANGNVTITTDNTHPVVTSCPQDSNLTVTGIYKQVQENEKNEWFMPHLNESTLIATAKANSLSTLKSNVDAVIEGHYFDAAYMQDNVNNNGTWILSNDLNNPPGNLSGTIFIDLSSVPGSTVKISSNDTSDTTTTPLTGHNFDTNPNMIIIKGGNLSITGNIVYNGVIFVLDGNINVQGSPNITGAVFAKNGVLSGGNQWTMTYNWADYTKRFSSFVLRKVVIDAVWAD